MKIRFENMWLGPSNYHKPTMQHVSGQPPTSLHPSEYVETDDMETRLHMHTVTVALQ